jgi:hypothetical protein
MRIACIRDFYANHGHHLQRVLQDNDIQDFARSYGRLHSYGGVEFWAWDTSGAPLVNETMPSFVYGRGKYDSWFTHGVIHGGHGRVIDATSVASFFSWDECGDKI